MTRPYQPVSAPRGADIVCKSWPAEAALRLLMNCLDPEVADDPEHLRVHGANGTAVRSWEAFDAIVGALKNLAPDQTLLVQSGRPVAVFPTHLMAPRVIIAHSMLVPAWSSADELARLQSQNLTIDGHMLAGSWLFTGLQASVASAYETWRQVAKKHFAGSIAGKLVVSGGLGAFGAAVATAAAMHDAVCLAAELDPTRIDRLVAKGVVHEKFDDLSAAIEAAVAAKSASTGKVVAWVGHAQNLLAALVDRHITPEIVTDATPAHTVGKGYVPTSVASAAEANTARTADPRAFDDTTRASIAEHLRAIVHLRDHGALAVEFGNALRAQAELGGVGNAFEIPGFFSAYLRPLVESGRHPLTIVALSGEADDLEPIDTAILETIGDDPEVAQWLAAAKARPVVGGLPARTVWLKVGDHARVAAHLNRVVRDQDVQAPVVLTRDDIDPGAVASPFRESEQMPDGSDPVADWPALMALMAAGNGATMVGLGQGGAVGVGFSLHASVAVVANGSPEADLRLTRVFGANPMVSLVRLADAGSESAAAVLAAAEIARPMLATPSSEQ